jgi:CO/xanthine dehydrogenase FAD-binding subunit
VTVREYLAPGSVAEVVDLLSTGGPDTAVMGGGTVMMPLITDGLRSPERVVSLRRAGLSGVTDRGIAIHIGATTTVADLLAPSGVDDGPQLEMLRDAARHTGAWAVRNLATIGGNLFTVPKGGDLAVALLALDASVRIASARGERAVPLQSFWTGPVTTVLQDAEVVVGFDVPRQAVERAFLKLGRRELNTPAVATVAVTMRRRAGMVEQVRIAIGGAGPFPTRATRAEEAVTGSTLTDNLIARAAAAAADDAAPSDDAIASAWYRRRMTGLLVRRALEQIAAPLTPADEPSGVGQ